MKLKTTASDVIIPTTTQHSVNMSKGNAKVLLRTPLGDLLKQAIEGEMSTEQNEELHRVGYVVGPKDLALVIDESVEGKVHITEVESAFFPEEKHKAIYEFATFELTEDVLAALKEAIKE